MTTENHVLMDRVDPDLSAEEQTYVRHYLGYADALIRSAEENASSEAGESGSEEGVDESEEDEQRTPERVSIFMDEPDPGDDDAPVRAA